MIPVKSKVEIAIMKAGGNRLRMVLEEMIKAAQPGLTTSFLDRLAEKQIQKQGGKPSFKMVPGYKWTTCFSLNDEVVHGIPGEDILKDGDLLGIDLGMYFKGYHSDLATTIVVGNPGKSFEKLNFFLEAGKSTLEEAISQAKSGNHIGDLSLTIEEGIKKAGFAPVKALAGHGIGKKLHENPLVPTALNGKVERTPEIKEGMTLAIEVIYNEGSEKVVLEDDGWTISTWDGKISGLFEESVAVTDNGPLILTR